LKAKIKYFLFFLGINLFLYTSCSSPSTEKNNPVLSDSVKIISEDPHKKSEYTEPCIVFLWPDSLAMAKLKAKDSDAFYTEADDYSFYSSQEMDLADSLKITYFSTDKKDLHFKTSDGKNILLDLSKIKEEDAAWGTYLFNGVDTPKLASITDLNRASLEQFFKK
jgi:hypothetical protein